jgi:short-subunit dehydrogenase
MKDLELNVLLTGATGGIGLQTATLLATRGANLLLAARDEQRLRRVRDTLRGFGSRVDTVAADVATTEGRQRLVGAALAFPGGIDVLVNNAGVNRFDLLDRQSDRDLEAIVNTNLLAPMLLTRKLLPLLRQREKATVLNVGSIVGSIGMPGQVAYCSSKFGLHGFSEALRRELHGTSVNVVYVAPRATDTDMNDPLMREMNERTGVRTDDSTAVARHIVQAITDARRERFIGWPERLFVKVNALFPGLVDRSLRKQARLLDRAPADNQPHAISHGVKG